MAIRPWISRRPPTAMAVGAPLYGRDAPPILAYTYGHPKMPLFYLAVVPFLPKWCLYAIRKLCPFSPNYDFTFLFFFTTPFRLFPYSKLHVSQIHRLCGKATFSSGSAKWGCAAWERGCAGWQTVCGRRWILRGPHRVRHGRRRIKKNRIK